jgi:pyruvate/2-oxoglutarate dehydrogenase complex dihydrolipoamide acyltransferase (E2) component
MPKLTDTMEEGVLLAWKKREGDQVHAGEVIAEIETDKAVMDLEAFAPGILRKILVRDGETVQSGTLIAVIAEVDEDITAALSDGVTAAPSIGNGAGSGPCPNCSGASGGCASIRLSASESPGC